MSFTKSLSAAVGDLLKYSRETEQDIQEIIEIAFSRGYECAQRENDGGPAIIGRDHALVTKLARELNAAGGANTTEPREIRRGYTWDAQILADGEPTGRVARVTVELDRVEE